MEYYMNIIFITVSCFIIVESIPSPEEAGEFGARQFSNRPKSSIQSRQQQNYPRPQSFYPTVNNNNNRNNYQDHRFYERNYDNRFSAVYGAAEKRPFNEGPNGRKSYNHPSTSISGTKRDPPLGDEPSNYRSMRRHQYEDRNNVKYLPHIERSYQQPTNRPAYSPRIPYQRSISENTPNRYRDFTHYQRSSYIEKQTIPLNRPASLVNIRYPGQNHAVDPLHESMKPSGGAHHSPPELPALPQQRTEFNQMLSNPKIQKYLASNHKRYLVLHLDGTVEHVDSLDSLVKTYPNYVIVKAGDIITNEKHSSLELISSTSREEILPVTEIHKVTQRIPIKQNEFSKYAYNTRVPYSHVTRNSQPIGTAVDNPYEYDADDNVEPIMRTTPTLVDDLTFTEAVTENVYAPTHFVETTTEYETSESFFKTNTEYGILEPSITINNYVDSIPFVEATENDVTYTDSTTEFALSSTPILITDEHETYTKNNPLEIIAENAITDAYTSLVTTQDYSTVAPTTNIVNDKYLDNVLMTKNPIAPKEEIKNGIIPKLRGLYPSALDKQHFGDSLNVNQINIKSNCQNLKSPTKEEESAANLFDIVDTIDSSTQIYNMESADIVSNADDNNTSNPVLLDSNYGTPSETSNQFYDYHIKDPDTPLTSENEDIESNYSLNQFVNTNDEQTPHSKHKIKSRRNLSYRRTTESSNNLISNDNNDTLVLHTTSRNIMNPFFPLGDPNIIEEESIFSTQTAVYDEVTSNPFLTNGNKYGSNPFSENTTAQTLYQNKQNINTKIIKPITENQSKTNPFIDNLLEKTSLPSWPNLAIEENRTNVNLTEKNVILADRVPGNFRGSLDDNKNQSDFHLFMDTNPFIEDHQNTFIVNVSDVLNPFTENYKVDNVALSRLEIPIPDSSLVLEEPEKTYATDVEPLAFLSTENSGYELTTTEIPDYNTIHDAIDEVPATAEVIVLTTTEKPTVWFKVDANFWDKLSNGTVPYDVVYFFQLNAKPIVEKDAKTTIFPNGTIVQEFIETVWEREGDSAPILVKSTKTVYPDEVK